jgi:hypothetical protein
VTIYQLIAQAKQLQIKRSLGGKYKEHYYYVNTYYGELEIYVFPVFNIGTNKWEYMHSLKLDGESINEERLIKKFDGEELW